MTSSFLNGLQNTFQSGLNNAVQSGTNALTNWTQKYTAPNQSTNQNPNQNQGTNQPVGYYPPGLYGYGGYRNGYGGYRNGYGGYGLDYPLGATNQWYTQGKIYGLLGAKTNQSVCTSPTSKNGYYRVDLSKYFRQIGQFNPNQKVIMFVLVDGQLTKVQATTGSKAGVFLIPLAMAPNGINQVCVPSGINQIYYS